MRGLKSYGNWEHIIPTGVMKKLSTLVIALLLSVEAVAEDVVQVPEFDFWSPLDCMTAVDALGIAYRSEMQARCVTIPALICENSDEPTHCFASMTAEIDDFIDEARLRLPPAITTGDRFLKRHYARALERMNLVPTPKPWCMEEPEATDDLCRFIDILEPLTATFAAGRWAGVSLRDLDHEVYAEADNVPDDQLLQLNPVNCLSAAFAIEWSHPTPMGVECVDVSIDHCKKRDDYLACVEGQTSYMVDFVAFARASLPEVADLPSDDLGYYRSKLDRFVEAAESADQCEDTTPEGAAVCRFANYASLSLSAFELAYEVSPDFLTSIDR